MAINYDDYQSVDDLPEEVQIPAGTWRVRGKKLTAAEGATVVTVSLIEPTSDVDPEEVESWTEAREADPVGFVRFRGSERAQLSQVRQMLITLGFPNPKSIVGAEFLAELKYDPNKQDPSKPWSRWRVVGPIVADEDHQLPELED